MLQVYPIHTSIINYTGLIYDRYRGIRYPDKKRAPVALFTILAWILAFCSVMPYTGFVHYMDFGELKGPAYQNHVFCIVDPDKQIEHYLRISFLLLFLIPSFLMVFLLIKTASELEYQRQNAGSCSCDSECAIWRQSERETLLRPSDKAETKKTNGHLVTNGKRSKMVGKKPSFNCDGNGEAQDTHSVNKKIQVENVD